ncbi:MAG: chorismate synthase [Bacteroidales bacterium]|nr:chorismate synthase [Bacteroidales bacterium]MDY6002275.1 chorismate synthase [Candidatus Cryptobacteroides sp.]
MNVFGKNFRVQIFGESHGPVIGVVIDGVKAGLPITTEDFAGEIARRKSGSNGTTPRIEADEPQILSGVFEGHATGTPLAIIFRNQNTHSSDYEALRDVPRPGHADWTANVKWNGFNDPRGGGHFSGRLTLPIVAAGVVAKKMLSKANIIAQLIEVGGVPKPESMTDVKVQDAAIAVQIWDEILAKAMAENDSVGGIVECCIDGLPAGIGEPFWDSAESLISHAIFAIPGVRGIEFGDGFAAARMKGSEHNDPFEYSEGRIRPAKNGSGGINGGITNGGPIIFRVAFKPTSSIRKVQKTLNIKTNELETLIVPGRHDACIALRAPVIVEAMAAIALADLVTTKKQW